MYCVVDVLYREMLLIVVCYNHRSSLSVRMISEMLAISLNLILTIVLCRNLLSFKNIKYSLFLPVCVSDRL